MDLSIRNGERGSVAAEVVAGPRLAVVERLMGGAEVDTDQDVFVVALKGNFVANEARLPPGFRTPTGTNLVLVFDASTKALVDLSLLKSDPLLEQFGTPIVVDP